MTSRWFLLAVVLLTPSLTFAQEQPTAPQPATEKTLDALIDRVLKEFSVPGAAIAIVRDGKVLHLKGYGWRDVEANKPVTPDTLFALASCTKAFTATAIASLVDAGKMRWDDPIRKHLPFFRLADPLASREATLEDALCHRTGLARHDVLRMQTWGRERLIRALADIQPSKPFRAEYQYNNLLYLTAGYAAGVADGSDWDTVVRRRLLEPLGMTGAKTNSTAMQQSPDYARPYVLKAGKPQLIPMRDTDNAAPGGSLKASARDMVRWLLFQLDLGKIDGKQIVSVQQMRQTHRPRIAVPAGSADASSAFTVQRSYALGWMVEDYRGQHLLQHGGAIDGYRSQVVLAPRHKLGIVILSNLGGTRVPETLSYSLLDHLLDLPAHDWIAHAKQTEQRTRANEARQRALLDQQRKRDTQPSLDLAAYAGHYDHPGYGRAEVLHSKEGLAIRWGTVNRPLSHYHLDVFRFELPDPHMFYSGDPRVQFHLDGEGNVGSMVFLEQEFVRVKKPLDKKGPAKREPAKDKSLARTVRPVDEKAIDDIVNAARKAFEAPGVAVAVVVGDKVIHAKGYGVRELGKPEPITADTLFAIASCSKAFTATAIGCLVEEGKLGWDDPVSKYLPLFRLRDPLADREATLRDLLSHRTGVVRHDILWVVHDNWTRDEMMRRAGLLKPDRSFRSEWGYNNLQYLMAGEASARAAGTTWEELVRSRLLVPLGMKTTNFSTRDLLSFPDHARPHIRKNRTEGPILPTTPTNIDNVAPAGSINSSVRELSAWMRFQLGGGSFEGKRILKPETLRVTHTPVIPVPAPSTHAARLNEGVIVQTTYALGWNVQDYRGQRMLTHSGSLLGYRSRVILLPEWQVGIAVLSNLESASVPEAVGYQIADALLGAEKRDWNSLFLETTSKLNEQTRRDETDLVKKRKKGTKPTLPLADYTGVFEEAAHGPITLLLEEGKLKASWGRYRLPVEHWHHDTFRLGEYPGQYLAAWGDRLLVFRLDRQGAVQGFRYLGHDFVRRRPATR